ncbi:MAG: Cro/Cl family transcriptional regulator [Desulfobacca sp.]|nr:Cro/Cl family transcriptional regulator [Desulfobacca sp.]
MTLTRLFGIGKHFFMEGLKEKLITKRLKELRLNKKLTLENLAKLTGFTKGYLSQIENSSQPPPIYTLSRISNALDVDMTEFFRKSSEGSVYQEITIGRRDHYKRYARKATSYGYIFEDLAPMKKGKNMEPFIVTVGFDRKIDIQKDFRHDGEEFIYVLEGTLELFFSSKSFVLKEGDCAYFDADKPHSGISLGEKKAKLLIVIYSYKRL